MREQRSITPSEIVAVPRERVDALGRRLERLLATYGEHRRPVGMSVRHPFAEIEQLLQGLELVVAREQEALAPVVELLDGVVCVSPRGFVDGARAADLNARIVSTVTELGARVVILDLGRVTEVDDRGAHELLQLVRGCPRLDARAIFAGTPASLGRRLALFDSTLGGAQIAGSVKEALRACATRSG